MAGNTNLIEYLVVSIEIIKQKCQKESNFKGFLEYGGQHLP